MAALNRLDDTLEPEDGIDECDYVDSDYEPAWEPEIIPYGDLDL